MHFQFKTCFYFKTEREEEIQVRKTDITDKIGDFNLMSQKHWKSNKNWIHCSVIIWRQDGQRKHGGEGAKARQERKKITSTVGWSRKSCNIATARKQKQMSHGSHISHPLPPSLPIHHSALLSPCSHSPDELATIFSFLSPLLLCSHYMFFLLLCFPQTALFPSLSLSFSPPPPLPLWMSGTVWLLLKPDYSPQWAHSTFLGLMPTTRPASGVTASMQTAPGTPLDLIRMHAVDWKEEEAGKGMLQVNTPVQSSVMGGMSRMIWW